MSKLHGKNGWKAAGVLVLFAVFVGAMLIGPALRRPPNPGPPADVPAMTNVPPAGSLHIEPE